MASTANTLRATVTADNAGTTAGAPAIVLIDGSDTAVTCNGLAGYVPISGDRVLVQRVGGQVEIVQFLNRDNITGQTFRTAVSGPRIEITDSTEPTTGDPTGTLAIFGSSTHDDPAKPHRLIGDYSDLGGGDFTSSFKISASGLLDDVGDPVTSFLRRAFVGLYSQWDASADSASSRLDISADYIDMTGTDQVDIFGAVNIGGADTGQYLLIGSNGGGTAIHELSYGLTTVSVTSDTNGSNTVPHGLSSTPALLLATAYGTSTWFATTTARNSSTFDAVIRQFQNTSGTVSIPVFWLAAW